MTDFVLLFFFTAIQKHDKIDSTPLTIMHLCFVFSCEQIMLVKELFRVFFY